VPGELNIQNYLKLGRLIDEDEEDKNDNFQGK
jgi:hypothetical protein